MNINHFDAAMNEIRFALTHNDAERSVIGSILIDDRCMSRLSFLNTQHFQERQHRVIWEEARRMYLNGTPIDLVTLEESLCSVGLSESIGGIAYLTDLAKNTPSSANVVAYANIVIDRFYRLELLQSYSQSILDLRDLNTSSDDLAQAAFRRVNDIRNTNSKQSGSIDRHVSELCEDWSVEFEQRFGDNPTTGITSGLEDLDQLLAPKQIVSGSVFVIGARPKMGKTALSLKIVDHLTSIGHCTQVFSLEMTGSQLVERSLGQIGGIKANALYPQDGGLHADDGELSNVLHTLGNLKERDLWVSTKPAVNLDEMERSIRNRYENSNGRLKAVFVDYLTLMDVDLTGQRPDLSYGMISSRLKVIAKELDLVVFLLIQLNRSLESRADKRPMPSDGRETGQIEQDCDYWLGLYRDHVYNESSDPNFTELLLRLNRHGVTGKVNSKFAGGRFDDWHGAAPSARNSKSRPSDDFGLKR